MEASFSFAAGGVLRVATRGGQKTSLRGAAHARRVEGKPACFFLKRAEAEGRRDGLGRWCRDEVVVEFMRR
jgi:hypothetical protein